MLEILEQIKNILGYNCIAFYNTSSEFRIMCRSEIDFPPVIFEMRIWTFPNYYVNDFILIRGDQISFEEIYEIISSQIKRLLG